MAAKVVQISLSEVEYEYLMNKSKEKGITIPMLIKQEVLPKGEYDVVYQKLLDLINPIKSGTQFTIREVFGIEWKEISKGTRLSVGRGFFKSVTGGAITNVKALDYKDSTNTQVYVKI